MANIQHAAWNLQGKTTAAGWLVAERVENGRSKPDAKTGGTFSVGYRVEKQGAIAFMKVFDVISAFGPGKDLAMEIGRITGEYNHEKALLDLCTTGRLSRVVKILDHGTFQTPFPLPFDPDYTVPLHYIIFERADAGDIRDVFNEYDQINDAVKLDYLHHVAVAIQQIHQRQVSHQDIKPSNVLIFKQNGEGAKLADFGRAVKKGVPSPHDSQLIMGARNYAPPEQLYGHEAPDWRNKREAADLYNFGSLVAFLFSGTNTTAGILGRMAENLQPGSWTGVYEDILPMVQTAYAEYLASIRTAFPEWARDQLGQIVMLCCEPDVYRRGDPKARAQHDKPLGVDRFIARLNMLRLEAHRRLKTRPQGT